MAWGFVAPAYMVGMTDISTIARENARHDNGQFGAQQHSAPEAALATIAQNYGSTEGLEDAIAQGELDADGVHAMLEGISLGSAHDIIEDNYGGTAELDEALGMGDVDADGIRAMLQRAAEEAAA